MESRARSIIQNQILRVTKIAESVLPAITLAVALSHSAGATIAASQEANGLARITFTKVLEGSVPEFTEITVDSNGSGTYDGRPLKEPPDPRPLKLSPATTRQLFALAHAMNDFNSIDLESHKNVANLGRKTFTYEALGRKNSAEFNYSLRREAQALTDLFEKIASVEEHINALEFQVKYDHLSLPRELLQIRIDLDNKALADPELMVPALQSIAHDSRFLHLAQVRAQAILERLGANGERRR
jgi:hypothetical protein